MKTAMLLFGGLWFVFGGLVLMGCFPSFERWHVARWKRHWGTWAPPCPYYTVAESGLWKPFLYFMGAIAFLVGCFCVIGAVYMTTQ